MSEELRDDYMDIQDTAIKKIKKPYRLLKPWHGVILLILSAIVIFILGGYLGRWFGIYGTALGELLLLILAVCTVLILRGDMKAVFQLRKPKLAVTFGTLVLWLGCFLFAMMAIMIMTFLFPQQMTDISTGVGESITSAPFIMALFIVSLMPAICEEAVFRGVFFNSLWNGIHKKWPVIIIVSVVFGIFHGSIWRFVPTCILGIGMGYLLFETNNMFYNMLFHAVNNAVPVTLLYLLEVLYKVTGMEDLLGNLPGDMFDQAEILEALPLSVLGVYLILGAVGIFLVYIGRHLLHWGQPGYDKGIFPRERRTEILVMICVCGTLAFIGFVIYACSLGVEVGNSIRPFGHSYW